VSVRPLRYEQVAFGLPILLTWRGAVIGIAVLAALNVLFLAATGVYLHSLRLPDSPEWIRSVFARHLNLGDENVLPAWYSSMLLLIGSVMAAVCFVAERTGDGSVRERVLRAGWIPISSLLALLSFTEIGSIHERLGKLELLNVSGGEHAGWVFTLTVPFLLATAYLVAFAWQRVARHRLACLLFVVGAALYATLPVHETIEDRVLAEATKSPRWVRPIAHVLLEEGCEIFGTLLLVAAMAVYAVSEAAQGAGQRKGLVVPSIPVPLAAAAGAAVLVAGDAAMRASQWATKVLPPRDTGMPENWFPSALAGLAALAAFGGARSLGDTKRGSPFLAVGAFAVVLSAYYGAHGRGWMHVVRKSFDTLPTFFNTALIAVAAALGIALARSAPGGMARVLALAWPPLLTLALITWHDRGAAGPPDYWACAFMLAAVVVQAGSLEPGVRDRGGRRS
jgi:hypothetical protein